MISLTKRRQGILIAVAMILCIPAVAMQFTTEVNWGLADFVIAGSLLLGAGFLCDYAWEKISGAHTRMVVVGAIILALLLIWIELAVGIFGTPFAGN
ncbi:MAG TPA: hypothetical protein PLX35_06215 [Cyclobacteriaceae bacterium]|nr:hypothetical protein [Cyclobacteriaceae bacterium]